jgi:hypothetical protein
MGIRLWREESPERNVLCLALQMLVLSTLRRIGCAVNASIAGMNGVRKRSRSYSLNLESVRKLAEGTSRRFDRDSTGQNPLKRVDPHIKLTRYLREV